MFTNFSPYSKLYTNKVKAASIGGGFSTLLGAQQIVAMGL